MNLGIDGFEYKDLRDLSRLRDLALAFDRSVEEHDAELFKRFDAYRNAMQNGVASGGLPSPEESALLIAVGRYLSLFVTWLFHVEPGVAALRTRAERDAEVARFKRDFVTKRVAKVTAPTPAPVAEVLIATIAAGATDSELALAITANRLLDLERDYPRGAKELAPSADARAALAQLRERLGSGFSETVTRRERIPSAESIAREAAALHELTDLLVNWTAARWKEGRFDGWTSFRLPQPLNFDRLVPTERVDDVRFGGEHHEFRRRDAFHLTDPRMTSREISDEAHYCIYCHERKKDSCSRGFPQPNNTYKPNPLGMALEGCPLDEKIGEMNFLRADGDAIGALALVMIDNPMCPGTGHRICNDCMRACIFQKQDPVNIPQIETGALTDVLFLPYGFEIYSLMTMWNPLNVQRPVALPYNGKNVLVVGLGPAGYTLAHYLANEGFGVVAIDGLKIEPIDDNWLHEPIRDARSLWEDLDDRVLAGFGGVSEYGITVRWDKNFLKVIRIALERKQNLRMYGGVRFGGTLTIEEAFDELGFDHIAIAAGAGTPTIVRMKNNLVRGMRQASDFLMALQLTGAFKKNSLANLQVRLPAIVIGGGLTAIDTATELFAYYPVQVEKVLERYESMCAELSEDRVRTGYDAEELAILDEFLVHGRVVREERARAAAAGEKPDFIPLVRGWGGVTIAYRKTMLDSPAYRLNFEEIEKAFEEGIAYAEMISPVEAVSDEYGHVKSLLFEKQVVEDGRWKDSGEIIELAAKTVMIAAGTAPNVIYEKEHPETFKLDKWKQFFQSYSLGPNNELNHELIEDDEAARDRGFFTSYQHPSRREKLISFYGDNHPKYAGNVVKAMASAKFGYPQVVSIFANEAAPSNDDAWKALVAKLDDGLVARVDEVNRLTPTIVEVVVRAPFAARHFFPGQFFRLQNFEAFAPSLNGTKLAMEGLALTGASVDAGRGLLSVIVLEMGGSSRLCAMLQKGEPVVLMGPTGAPTDIPRDETVLLAGGGLGNAVLFSIARALKDNGCRVIYFAGYKKAADVFKRDEIEAGTEQVIWSIDAGDPIPPRRPQDLAFTGNIVQAMLWYAQSNDLSVVRRIIAIGSDGMMRAVKDARHGVLAPHLDPAHVGIGSINSPMQCMMKQVCAQCLQRHVDPKTGKESFVFSCFNQDQPLDEVDFTNLRARLRQNTVLEKLTNLWLTRELAKNESRMVG
ncbi:MAG TPA: FAD-dependent oxidoreductase [Thermoanaerobaculia bacterium]|jgi:NADPH-dependent glutamate synthase beta subunit-like oxidoreductase/NAD(P)H-flavin reductase|nr:FAD-dependent oxidoreductase [Thermoanaerobaculia bacterium]